MNPEPPLLTLCLSLSVCVLLKNTSVSHQVALKCYNPKNEIFSVNNEKLKERVHMGIHNQLSYFSDYKSLQCPVAAVSVEITNVKLYLLIYTSRTEIVGNPAS